MKKYLSILLILLIAASSFAAIPFAPNGIVPSDTSEVTKAKSLHKQVIEEDRMVKSFEQLIAVTLPQGISKKIGNDDYIVVLETMSFSPTGAKLTAYMEAGIPRSEQTLALKGKDINFAPGGFTGGARLELIKDVDVKLGNSMNMVIKGGTDISKTFVECDCKGYKSMGLQGEIQFNREKLLPVGSNGKVIQDKNVKVTAPFETQLIGWNDFFLLEIGISPFQIKNVNDFNFKVNSAVFDFSEAANSPSMVFPNAYQSTDFVDGNQRMWKGFFLKDVIVNYTGLNDSASTGNTKTPYARPTIEAHNILIDNIGLSGEFRGNNIIPIEKGTVGGWPFALDEIYAKITKNQLENCWFNGRLIVPPLCDTATLYYDAFIDPGNQYSFIVATRDTLRMDIWSAKLRLDPNSSIDISVVAGRIRPKAILNGNLNLKKEKVELANIDFEELTLTPEAPYITAKSFSLGSGIAEQKLGKFPFSINNVGMTTEYERTGLSFDLNLNLVDQNSGGFTGKTGLTVFARSYKENNRQRWMYDGMEVNKIAFDIKGSAYTLRGSANWFKDDRVYGNGFSGNITAEIKVVGELQATAVFGNIDGMRYFYADALYDSKFGVPIFTGLNLYMFGGGIYHHMRRNGYNETSNGSIGQTASGIVYKPDITTLFGFKATLGIGLTKREAFNADATFEMAFNSKGGVDRIICGGNGYFMTPTISQNMAKLAEKCKKIANDLDPNAASEAEKDKKASMAARVLLDFDFRNNSTHGNLSVAVNLAGGVIKGTGPGGNAGEAVIHFAPGEWYIYVGTPQKRIGLSVLNFAQINAYFMMGTKILAFPPLPAKVTSILNNVKLDLAANEGVLGQGKGIAFGAGLSISTGKLRLVPFYAEFDAGLGFDVMLAKYENVSCKGLAEGPGINGWYAKGQVWAYIQGSIGIGVHWRFINGDFEILNVGAAAVLQAELPNPFWMRGVVGGQYSILKGLVKGSCTFDFEIGKRCEMINNGGPTESAIKGLNVISEATPSNGTKDVSVFDAPQAVFNMSIDKVFDLEGMDGTKTSFKIVLDNFTIKDGSNKVAGTMEWNADHNVVAFNPFELLPSEKTLTLELQVSFKENKNGSWQTVLENGNTVIERLNTSFTTGKAPDYIPMRNVLYCYPMPMMFNYYQNETSIGYVQLDRGQSYLFVSNPGAEWKHVGRFTDKQGNKKDFAFTYIETEKKISFTRPAGLKNNTIYSFDLVKVPLLAGKTAVDKNVTDIVETTKVKADGQEDFSTVEITTQDAEGDLALLQEKNIFSISFRTSLYNTLSAKIDGLVKSNGYKYLLETNVLLIGIGISGGETFDNFEGIGTNTIGPLIQFTNVLENDPWYGKLVFPFIYKNYPNPYKLKNRQVNPVGVPPLKTIVISIQNGYTNLKNEDLIFGVNKTSIGYASFRSQLAHYVANDYSDIAAQACNQYYGLSNLSVNIKQLIENTLPPIFSGSYKFNINYNLPGLNTVSSSKQLTIKL